MPDESKHFIIRAASKTDFPAIIDVLQSANMHYIPSAEMPELDLQCCCVAEVKKRIVGMSGYKILTSDEAKTTLMAVLPEFRGWGIGLALQKWRMNELCRHGIKSLVTNADRPETIAWYKQHFGYQKIGTIPKEHEFGHPDISQWTTLQVDLTHWQESR
jgi:ribosomal-protein-alanine N-acetyltransferase